MIYIYTDGACSGNPGPGGSSFIAVKNEEKIYEWKMPIPEATNNICELIAIIEGCLWAKKFYPLEKIILGMGFWKHLFSPKDIRRTKRARSFSEGIDIEKFLDFTFTEIEATPDEIWEEYYK